MLIANKYSVYPVVIGCFLWWSGTAFTLGVVMMIIGVYWGFNYGKH